MSENRPTDEDLDKRLEALKVKASIPALSEADAARARKRAEIRELEAKIKRKEKEARDAREDELFEQLEAKHAGQSLHRIDTEEGMVVLRTPPIPKTRHFQSIALKGKLSPDAIDDFVRPCIVFPDADALEAMLERYTLLAATLCQFAQEVGSAEAERRGKKSS
jgi:hypothetical protein